jgi:prepilin-type N-terminal cleavage/methylation domain-containing protein
MSNRQTQRGFSLLELLIALALTGVVMAAAVTVYENSVRVSNLVSTRAELQSEMRAAMNQIGRDLNQAGTGIPLSGLPIPSVATGGVNPLFGCDATNCYVPAGAFTAGNLNRVTPADSAGILTSEQTDAIVMTYIDPIAPATDLTSSATGLDWSPYATTNISDDGSRLTMPAGTTPALNDPEKGLAVGDLLLMQNQRGTAIAEVTGFDAASGNIFFAANDPLKINQPSSTTPVTGTLATLREDPIPATGDHYKPTSVSRIIMVTYFVWKDPNDSHLMLMRQVNGRIARPVAEYIEDLQITYDVLDETKTPATLVANLPDAAVGSPATTRPDLIRKVNLRITARSPQKNAQGLYDRMSIATSVGPRNLSFHDKYN